MFSFLKKILSAVAAILVKAVLPSKENCVAILLLHIMATAQLTILALMLGASLAAAIKFAILAVFVAVVLLLIVQILCKIVCSTGS